MKNFEIHIAVNQGKNIAEAYAHLQSLGLEVEYVHGVINFDDSDELSHHTGHDLPELKLMATAQVESLFEAITLAVGTNNIMFLLSLNSNFEIEQMDESEIKVVPMPRGYKAVPDSPAAEAHFGFSGKYGDLADAHTLAKDIAKLSGVKPHQAVLFSHDAELTPETQVSWYFTVYAKDRANAAELRDSIGKAIAPMKPSCVISEAVLLVAERA